MIILLTSFPFQLIISSPNLQLFVSVILLLLYHFLLSHIHVVFIIIIFIYIMELEPKC